MILKGGVVYFLGEGAMPASLAAGPTGLLPCSPADPCVPQLVIPLHVVGEHFRPILECPAAEHIRLYRALKRHS